jgi:glycosyltransferase involved in cell wall biosynthesis
MIEGHDIICFSNDWHSDPLSKKHIMQRLAKKNRVLWINSIGNRRPEMTMHDFKRIFRKLRDFTKGQEQVDARIHILQPVGLPFHASTIARWINRRVLRWSLRRACRRLGFRNPITWTFDPASAYIAGSLGEKTLVYHCVDEFSEFTGTDKEALLALERRLIERSDCVIVSSDRLFETKRKLHPNTHVVTHGVDVAHFRRACDPATAVPQEIRNLKKPVIGFFGLVADWVDLGLIRSIAQSRPNWNVVLIGKATTDLASIRDIPNIHILGPKPYASLPAYTKGFDVAILPFAINELTLAANPLKLREYLAAGLPVVATAIPEAEKLGHVLRIARNNAEFLAQIESILSSGKTGPQLAISNQMDSESWDHKVEELSRIYSGLPFETAAA